MRLIQDFFFDVLYFQFGFPVWRWLLTYSNLGSPGFLCIHRLVSFISSSSLSFSLQTYQPYILFWHFKQPYVRHSYPTVQDSWTLSLYFQSMVQNLFDLLPVYSLFSSISIMLSNPSMALLIIITSIVCFFLSRSFTCLVFTSFCYICSFLCPEEIFKFVFNLRILGCTIPVFGLFAGLLLLWDDAEASLSCCPLFLWALFMWTIHSLLSLNSLILFVR